MVELIEVTHSNSMYDHECIVTYCSVDIRFASKSDIKTQGIWRIKLKKK